MDVRICPNCQGRVAANFKDCPFCKGSLPTPELVVAPSQSTSTTKAQTIADQSDSTGQSIWQKAVSIVENGIAEESPQEKRRRIERESSSPGPRKSSPAATKLIQCKDCGHEVSKNAQACPGCGSDKYNAEDKGFDNAIAVVVLVFLVYFLYQCSTFFSDDTPARTYSELSSAEKMANDKGKAWSGARTALKNSLRDPESYEEITHRIIVNPKNQSEILVYLKYRAKNGFGGFRVSEIAYKCRRNTYDCIVAAE